MNNETFPQNSASFLIALFKDPRDAENAYNGLLKKGYKKEDITLMMSEDIQKEYFSNEENTENVGSRKTPKGHGGGSAVWINKWGVPMIVGVHTLGSHPMNSGVRLSGGKFTHLFKSYAWNLCP